MGVTRLAIKSSPQPKLPQSPKWLGPWPAATRRWWESWGAAAQAELFTSTDWDFLVDTALLHAQVWKGDTKLAAELRLRVSKFGATAEDRARLRYVVSNEEPEDTVPKVKHASRARYGELRMVPGAAAGG